MIGLTPIKNEQKMPGWLFGILKLNNLNLDWRKTKMGIFGLFGKKEPKETGLTGKQATVTHTQTADELFELGKQHLNQDDAKAFTYFSRAAEIGHVKAMRNTAVCYWSGKGTAFDIQKAVYWYKKAAEHGNVLAMRDLANFYIAGVGVEKNEKIAKDWLKKAVDSGDERASETLNDFDQLKNLLAEKIQGVMISRNK